MAQNPTPSVNVSALRRKLEGGELTDKNHSGSNGQDASSIESTGFNLIKLIRLHMSHNEPVMFFVVQYYMRLRRVGGINRTLFWVIAYTAQLIDMLFSLAYGILMLIVLIGVVIAILRGIGLDTFVIDFIKELQGLHVRV